MSEVYTTPIAVFAYNRPTHLRLALEALARCDRFAECDLFIFCDAGKGVADTRSVAHRFVEQYGGRVIERPKSMGYHNIVEGITQMCDRYGRVIVVEDDVIAAPDFLSYMLAGLDRYEHEDRAFMISGFMYAFELADEPPAFFLPLAIIWGWATWARAWRHYEWFPKDWRRVLGDPGRRYRFDFEGTRSSARNIELIMSGKLNTWDVQWAFAMFQQEGLCLYPRRSLTWNCGMGGGVHAFGGLLKQGVIDHRIDYIHGHESREDYRKPRLNKIVLPDRVEVDEAQKDRLLAQIRATSTPWRRVRRNGLRILDLTRRILWPENATQSDPR